VVGQSPPGDKGQIEYLIFPEHQRRRKEGSILDEGEDTLSTPPEDGYDRRKLAEVSAESLVRDVQGGRSCWPAIARATDSHSPGVLATTSHASSTRMFRARHPRSFRQRATAPPKFVETATGSIERDQLFSAVPSSVLCRSRIGGIATRSLLSTFKIQRPALVNTDDYLNPDNTRLSVKFCMGSASHSHLSIDP
jgi:hypothetical protein